MNYNFDTQMNRRNTNSLKWNVAENELPMWVADMDFQTAPEIKDAMEARAAHGIFGYTDIPDAWYRAYITWWKKRHSFEMEKDWLIFCTGVVPALSSLVRKLTTPAEKVLIQTPVYNIFFNSIQNNGREVLQSPLKYDKHGYFIDFDDLEKKLSDPQTSLMILCNPHNPIGKIWNKEVLEQIGELCHQYHVTVLSDEIHCDLTDNQCQYTPFAAVSEKCRENSVICISPSKAFNLAGMQSAAVVVPDSNLRHKVWRALNTDEIAEPNAFAVDAAIAAFSQGDAWLDALKIYIKQNREFVTQYIENEISDLEVISSEATYLVWIDCRKMVGFSSDIAHFIREKTGLYLSDGRQFGGNGEQFLRMNIACPRSVLADGLKRLKKGVEAYQIYTTNLGSD